MGHKNDLSLQSFGIYCYTINIINQMEIARYRLFVSIMIDNGTFRDKGLDNNLGALVVFLIIRPPCS